MLLLQMKLFVNEFNKKKCWKSENFIYFFCVLRSISPEKSDFLQYLNQMLQGDGCTIPWIDCLTSTVYCFSETGLFLFFLIVKLMALLFELEDDPDKTAKPAGAWLSDLNYRLDNWLVDKKQKLLLACAMCSKVCNNKRSIGLPLITQKRCNYLCLFFFFFFRCLWEDATSAHNICSVDLCPSSLLDLFQFDQCC